MEFLLLQFLARPENLYRSRQRDIYVGFNSHRSVLTNRRLSSSIRTGTTASRKMYETNNVRKYAGVLKTRVKMQQYQ